MTSSMFAGAVERNLNIIVSTAPGQGVVTSTLEDLRKISGSILVFDEFSRQGDVARLSSETEIIVFNAIQHANSGLKDAAAELMNRRSLGGIKLPELKSVVGFFIRSTDECDDLAAGYAALGPSLSMEWY